MAAERAALGDKASDRVAASEAFLKANGATDDHLAALRGFPALVPLFEGLQAKLSGTTVTAPVGDAGARKFGDGWYPKMNKQNAA